MSNRNVRAVMNSDVIEGIVERLNHNPSNDLSDEVCREMVSSGWDDQWLNWDDLGGNDPGWGDIGD